MPIPQALHITKFTDYEEVIQMLYELDDDFKTLCNDYSLNKVNIEKCAARARELSLRLMEYESLSDELEQEILEYVIKIS